MADRDAQGRLLPGHRSPGPGRPKRQIEESILASLREAFTPEEIVAELKDALSIAKSQNSTRGIVAVLELIINYAIGKPTQRVQLTGQDTLADVLAQLRAGSESDEAAV